MKTLEQFATEITEKIKMPHALSTLQLEMATEYASIATIQKDLRIKKAAFWMQRKQFVGEKRKSDKEIELEWYATEEGEKDLRATIEEKALTKLMSACKAHLRILTEEARNQM